MNLMHCWTANFRGMDFKENERISGGLVMTTLLKIIVVVQRQLIKGQQKEFTTATLFSFLVCLLGCGGIPLEKSNSQQAGVHPATNAQVSTAQRLSEVSGTENS